VIVSGVIFSCGRRTIRSGPEVLQTSRGHEPVLDPALRQRLQDQLFDRWLADTTREAALDLAVVGTAG
jgi:truncated hemoglobin YjbI